MAASSSDASIQRRSSLWTSLLPRFIQRLIWRGTDPDPDAYKTPEQVLSPVASATVCYAVDVSRSTEPWVLRMEKKAITAISGALNKTTQYSTSNSSILPWNDVAYERLPLDDLDELISDGGTNPAAIFHKDEYKRHLHEARLWFLMTDGEIDQYKVREFSHSILKAGVHGTACVIVTFGHCERPPSQCNVSVGISVFAVAPHCLFLYHAIHEDTIYVIQAKGCFKELLPEEKRFILFNALTRWDDLHIIVYEDLAKVLVPQPTEMLRDSIMLPNGKVLDMRDIYHNRVSNNDTMELLSDPASLDVMLLAANTRGTSYQIEAWLERFQKQHSSAASKAFDVEDVGGMGLLQLTTLIRHVTSQADADTFWDVLRNTSASEDPLLDDLKASLRYRHQLNWDTFVFSLNKRYKNLSKMQKEVDGILSNMSHIQMKMSAPSPALLTPMSSLPRNMDQGGIPLHSFRFDQKQNMSSLGYSFKPSYIDRVGPSSNEPSSVVAGAYDEPGPQLDITTMTFLPEFRTRDVSTVSHYDIERPPAYDTCILCNRPGSIQTLLLYARSALESTPGLPVPDSLSEHEYPLILGNYAETDVVIPLVTCDGCAFLLQQARHLPNGGGSVAACLPLVPLTIVENRSKWVELVSEVYEHRFSQNITLLVFLSTLCSTVEDLEECDDDGVKPVRGWFEWVCREIMSLPSLAALAGLTPTAGILSGKVKPSMPLSDILMMVFSSHGRNSAIMELPLLAYPIHGFIVIVRLARMVKEIDPSQIELLVWKKLCYYLIEQHAEMQTRLGVEVADERLDDFLFDPSPLDSMSIPNTTRKAYSVFPVANLLDTHLLNQDTLDRFRRIHPFWVAIETQKDSFQYALAVFLHLLNDFVKSEPKITNPSFCFSRLQYQADKLAQHTSSKDVLECPGFLTEGMSAFLISQCITLSTTSKT
ncbi:unnamed protein product [Clonostachys rosea]|uniref:Uncharacterized protein n=1 Tax=Bionectria ochroleuca TaxID=29856 RepID=A0ABY6UKW0_BIOOC|nr:unnamed protein product [Clonostachys rosea]